LSLFKNFFDYTIPFFHFVIFIIRHCQKCVLKWLTEAKSQIHYNHHLFLTLFLPYEVAQKFRSLLILLLKSH
jgi:hypothetical protein